VFLELLAGVGNEVGEKRTVVVHPVAVYRMRLLIDARELSQCWI
jgi:hypothetical protein